MDTKTRTMCNIEKKSLTFTAKTQNVLIVSAQED